ncbi:putative serine/threonine-protein kinase WNK7 [Acorus calamus]|uniref:non-specific serine/threonine protein kinase n=1 Tax=Acorus calamus TaxID=4465 RepID=A0AAV9EDP4_ACOCL|nr:putative serine/threonine-protein kinase WNK7 [Acorus calamus]
MDLVDDASGETDPPDDDIIAIDGTGRYICYNEILDHGAFETVYKAFDKMDGIEVAWKQIRIDELILSPGDLERLCSELHLMKVLKHGNIIKSHFSWVDDDNKTINIITEFFTSGSLRQYVEKHKKVDLKVLKGWARQILNGLDYLHSQNPPIIHRDLKCDNIFINGNWGEVKIGNFGLETIMKQVDAHNVIGTPEFMAPELYGEDYNELVDIYSFGMCMLEMVTFEYPYSECENSAQIYEMASSGIMPAALDKVKDLDVKIFISKCLVPATQRLPAKELLKDPFFQWNGLNGSRELNESGELHPKITMFGEHCVMSEEPNDASHISLSVNIYMYICDPPTTSVVDSGNVEQPIFGLVVKKITADYEFTLSGERKDEDSVSLTLRMLDLEGDAMNYDFLFYLESDTALSLASELVEECELASEHVKLTAELIDLLLLNLIPEWKPCLPVHQLTSIDGFKMSTWENNGSYSECGQSLVGSFQNILEAVDVPSALPCADFNFVEGCTHPIYEANEHVKHDEIMSHIDFKSLKTNALEDQSSEGIFNSTAFAYGSDSIGYMFSGSNCMHRKGNVAGEEIRETLPMIGTGSHLDQNDHVKHDRIMSHIDFKSLKTNAVEDQSAKCSCCSFLVCSMKMMTKICNWNWS